MSNAIELGRLFGIPLRIRGWGFLALAGGMFVLGYTTFRSLFAGWGTAEHVLAAGALLALYVLTMLLHEVAHAMVAMRNGLRVDEVALIGLGARVSLAKPTPNPPLRVVALFAAAGPLSDLLLAFVLAFVMVLTFGKNPHIFGVAFVACCVNLSLAVSNLLPIFPLDGGRLFRVGVLAWQQRRSH